MTPIEDNIVSVITREREGRDQAWYEQMRECFHEDSWVNMAWFTGSGPDFVAASRGMAGRGDITRHRLYVPMVHSQNKRAVVTMPMNVDMRVMLHDVEVDITTYARAIYRLENRDDRWAITGLSAVYGHDTLAPSMPGQTIPIDNGELAALRPSYRMLTYYFQTRGYQISPDLPGDDRPETVREALHDAMSWAGITVS